MNEPAEHAGLTVTHQVHFQRGRKSRKAIIEGPPPETAAPVGRVPRISRLMALALRLERLIETGEVKDQAEIARLGHVTRARVTQIMSLLHLAPDIQEAILFLPLTTKGRDPIREKHVRPIAAELNWRIQRETWTNLVGE
ncbi:MAG: hypothetical protein KBC05_14840 [Candidatus Hydrogenedentes bacterium]|nr:hypothetical protein [Candidatus Hydrogenedentota bacterium]